MVVTTQGQAGVATPSVERGGRIRRSLGPYLKDGVPAEISGDAIPIGLANSKLQIALAEGVSWFLCKRITGRKLSPDPETP